MVGSVGSPTAHVHGLRSACTATKSCTPLKRMRNSGCTATIFAVVVVHLVLALPEAAAAAAAWLGSSLSSSDGRVVLAAASACRRPPAATALGPPCWRISNNGRGSARRSRAAIAFFRPRPAPPHHRLFVAAGDTAEIDLLNSLQEMDVVVYSEEQSSEEEKHGDGDQPPRLRLGAVEEDGRMAPLAAWTDEPAFGTMVGFVADLRDDPIPLLPTSRIRLHAVVPPELVTYGSRQVGGGKGPGNPHGEESERLYYVEVPFLEEHGVDVDVRPDLEITW